MQVFIITGVAVSSFFIFFILAKKNRKRADYLLVLINLLMIGFLVIDILVREEITVMRLFVQTVLPYFLFSAFLFYALESLQQKWKRWWIVFILPTFLTTIYVAADMFFLNQYNEEELHHLYNYPPLGYHIFFKGNQILFVIALLWLIKKVKRYAQEINDSFSFTEPIQLNWLIHFSWIYLIITIISLAIFIISNLNLLPINIQVAFMIVSSCTVLAIFYISFHGIRQYSIAEYYGKQASQIITEAQEAEQTDQQEKYRSSSLTPGEQEAIYLNLVKLFEEKQLYGEPKLQLSDVSEALLISSHSLSQTINTMAGMPFYDFVNGYRVKHLRKLLEDPTQKRYTILALGLESGFNSKASLNRVFKEATGISPSEYQKRHLHKE